MLLSPSCVFLHVPKTGGTWVREALRAGGVPFEEFDEPHAHLSLCPSPDKFKFAFVRHPLTLYQSYWRFKMTNGWDADNEFDVECGADSFQAFVENVLAGHPGWCSRMFEDFVGERHNEIEFIGRFEQLANDLVRALRLAGEPFDEAALRAQPKVNVSVWPVHEAQWPAELAVRVIESERDALVRFKYGVPARSGIAPLGLLPAVLQMFQ